MVESQFDSHWSNGLAASGIGQMMLEVVVLLLLVVLEANVFGFIVGANIHGWFNVALSPVKTGEVLYVSMTHCEVVEGEHCIASDVT